MNPKFLTNECPCTHYESYRGEIWEVQNHIMMVVQELLSLFNQILFSRYYSLIISYNTSNKITYYLRIEFKYNN